MGVLRATQQQTRSNGSSTNVLNDIRGFPRQYTHRSHDRGLLSLRSLTHYFFGRRNFPRWLEPKFAGSGRECVPNPWKEGNMQYPNPSLVWIVGLNKVTMEQIDEVHR